MKTPDSRQPFKSATRHYHRYREENRSGWSDWVDGRKSGTSPRSPRWKRIILTLGGLCASGLIGAIIYNAI